ncbi:YqaA family protein [Natrinema gelatinilyticum]|uniref:YqaA family protein n=1 Tax=Natrinema gelatinilyticum TaxID=2961571 RepID=UPI0020C2B0F7|nr:VTT domain-containing protein [Natrinema gelatinilyticum]
MKFPLVSKTGQMFLPTTSLDSLYSSVFTSLSSDFTTGILEYGQTVVDSATGWPGLGIIFVYSFLIAFVLPGPSEVVLAAPLNLGIPLWGHLGLIMSISAAGKAVGSLVAFHLGQEAKKAGPIVRWLRQSRFDVVEWSERRTVSLARQYGYSGLALALCVPFFPDTISIYAFAILEEDYLKFAIATFVGSLGRLVVTLSLFGGAITVL